MGVRIRLTAMLRSFRFQLTLAFGLGVLLLAALLSAGLGSLAARVAMRDQSDTLKTLAASTATMLGDGLFERLREIELLALTPVSNGIQGWSPLLQHVQRSRQHFSWVALTRRDGVVLAATHDMLLGRNVNERPWFRASLQGPHVGDVHTARLLAQMLPPSISGEPVRFIDFAAPIRDEHGQVEAVLAVHASWDWAHDVISSLRSPLAREHGVRVFIFDRRGDLIHRPVGDAAASRPPSLAALHGGAATVVRWDDGQDYLTVAAALPSRREQTDLGWTVVTRQPLSMATAAADRARGAALALGALAALLASAGAWVVAGRLAEPLSRIAEAARRVHAGQLDTAFPTPSGAQEIRGLTEALTQMTASLHRRERELSDANALLETRVAQRTAELTQTTEALQQANAELEKLAGRDALTGLLNRRRMDEALLSEMARHRRTGKDLTLVICDVDHFKRVNDQHGHAAGDEVLKSVALALAGACRVTDIVGRFGGEEFVVLMPETPAEGAAVACAKLRAAIEAARPVVPVTMSFGCVTPAQFFASGTAALHAADQALYRAKNEGRNRVCAFDGDIPDGFALIGRPELPRETGHAPLRVA